MARLRLLFVAVLATIPGCATPRFGETDQCSDCREDLASAQISAPDAVSPFAREYTQLQEQTLLLLTQLDRVTAERDDLRETLSRFQRQDVVTRASMERATAEVGVTRQELDRTNSQIAQIRSDLAMLAGEMDQAENLHRGEIDRFSRRLDELLTEYGADATTGRGTAKASRDNMPYFESQPR